MILARLADGGELMPANNPGSKQTRTKSEKGRDTEDTLRFDQDDVTEATRSQGPTSGQNEGEGSRSADREYRRGLEHFMDSDDVEERAEEAEEALEGDEAESLTNAEQKGKRGPHSN
jgi:hypothetical protein